MNESLHKQAKKKLKSAFLLKQYACLALQSYNDFALCECLVKDFADHSILAVTSR